MAEGLLMCCMIELTSLVVQEGGRQYLQHRKQLIEEGRSDELLSSRIKAAKNRAVENIQNISPSLRKSMDTVYQRMSQSLTPETKPRTRTSSGAIKPSAESLIFPHIKEDSVVTHEGERNSDEGEKNKAEAEDVVTELKPRPLSRRIRDSFGHFSDIPQILKKPAQYLSNISPLRMRTASHADESPPPHHHSQQSEHLQSQQDDSLVQSVETSLDIIPSLVEDKKEKGEKKPAQRKKSEAPVPYDALIEKVKEKTEKKELTEFEKFIADIMIFVKEEYELQRQNPDSVLLKQKQYHDKLLRNLAEIRLKNF